MTELKNTLPGSDTIPLAFDQPDHKPSTYSHPQVSSYLAAQTGNSMNDQFFQFFMEAPTGFCMLTGPEFWVEYVNPFYQQIFPGRDLLGKTAVRAMPELAQFDLLPILEEVYRTGVTYEGKEIKNSYVNPFTGTTEERYFNLIYQARRNDQGLIYGIAVFRYEVTETVLAKRQAAESEQQLRSILNVLPQIIWTNTAEGELSFINERWQAYTGLNLEQSQGYGWLATVFPADLEICKATFSSILGGTTGGEFELRKRGPGGHYRWHLTRIQPILDETGKVLFWVGASTDIHELKKSQQQKDDFINIASHELKTPLTTLKASLQLMIERKEELTFKLFNNLMSRASGSLDKVVNLVEDLLNVGRFSQGQLELDKSTVTLSALIHDYSHELAVKGQYSIEFTGDPCLKVCADAKRIEQVLINMVNNAIKYAPESRTIRIHIEEINKMARISVIDHGPGISPDILARLFDRYYRVENNNHNTGLGLGLYICAEIVKKHGGEIDVTSCLGLGSTFWFTLPLHQ